MLSHEARIVESILFIENEALTIEKISAMASLSEKECEKAIKELEKVYSKEGHGIFLKVNDDESICFAPSSDLYDNLRQTYGKKVDKRLSRAALETLSIVAYSQPITRKEIDNIRGVTSDTIVRLLRDREYIKIVGRKDVKVILVYMELAANFYLNLVYNLLVICLSSQILIKCVLIKVKEKINDYRVSY